MRDFSPGANESFAGQVPADLLSVVHKQPGTWTQIFGSEADEIFQVYHQARYINEIAAAGKAEFAIPLYINAWLTYPPAELPERRMPIPGIQYPSGGAVQKFVGLWRALAPSVDMIGPDIYANDSIILCGYRRSAEVTTSLNSCFTRSARERSAFPHSALTRRGGTFSEMNHPKPTHETLHYSVP
ncbi:MAG: hypothetical protein DMG61_19360 [Acidobacteria bacterium]|nr:MAG: hypothetical protein DMG61_19360 [Acidobacteriota bacterium]